MAHLSNIQPTYVISNETRYAECHSTSATSLLIFTMVAWILTSNTPKLNQNVRIENSFSLI